jgi:hypothetical protein|tara:strand:+ start:4881 stop:5384 length:504 start_codon:yes stop_codon:yes gene_type:complete
MINANDSVNNHFKIHRSASLLDVLIEFDKFLDDLNVYSYDNWLEGEVVDGPHLTRYWCEISLMYPYEQMPDPAGGERLLGKKCKVYYKEDYYLEPREVKTPDDYEPGSRKPKSDKIPVWVVKIKLPKKYVLTYDRTEADQEELAKGFQQGLDDETRQSGNADAEADI